MLFVRIEELKVGMRLGKPIYNKNGVLLHERNSKLTQQAINGIRNFQLMGLYILEPAEPLPPMSEEDINFERFQTMAVFSIREDLELIAKGKKDKGLDWLCTLVMKNYSKLPRRVTFVQSLRSKDDFVYKHSLNVAILSAIIAGQMNLSGASIKAVIRAAILHDVGILGLPLSWKSEDMSEDVLELIRKNTLGLIRNFEDFEQITSYISNTHEFIIGEVSGDVSMRAKESIHANIIYIADAFDRMTAMKYSEEPTSELLAIQLMQKKPDLYDKKVVKALVDGINILYPGVCIELTNRDTGVVLIENDYNIFEPQILSFCDNQIYDLSNDKIRKKFALKDIMKTMDNRIKMDKEILNGYQ